MSANLGPPPLPAATWAALEQTARSICDDDQFVATVRALTSAVHDSRFRYDHLQAHPVKTSPKALRQELRALGKRAGDFAAAVTTLSEDAKILLTPVAQDRHQSIFALLDQGTNSGYVLAALTEVVVKRLPSRRWSMQWRQGVAVALRDCFRRHGVAQHFTATATDYNQQSPAVRLIVALCHSAGDSRLTPATARKLVEEAKARGETNERLST